METTPGKRVQLLRESKGFKSLTAFAEASGLKIGTLSAIEADRSAPSFETLATLQRAFPDVSLEWLISGEGSMLKDGRTLSQLPPPVPSEAKPRREGLPATPGTATPQEADFVGRLIQRLENELEDSKRREEQQQRMIETLLGKSPASAYAAAPVEPRQQIQGFRTAATLAPEGKVIAMWTPIQLEEAA